MIVCLDIQPAAQELAGIGRYTKGLAQHLPALADRDTVRCAYFDFRRRGLPFDLPGAELRAVSGVPRRVLQRAWRAISWPPFDLFAGKADLFHFPSYVRPPVSNKAKTVVTIHDLSYLRFPETLEPGNLRTLRKEVANACDKADAILTDSAFIATEIEELLEVSTQKLHPIHLGLEPVFTPAAESDIAKMRTALGLERPYLLFVGTVEPRKNIPLLVTLLERLTEYDGDLVIAGMQGWRVAPILERVAQSPLRARIRLLHYVPEPLLAALYGGAELFVFPSRYEGFGFTPLEAMACGLPVICTTAGSLAEVVGAGARRMDSLEPEAWTDAVRTLLTDSEQRQSLRKAGLAHAATFTWQRTAAETWQVYRSL